MSKGRQRKGNKIDGIILLDKPTGISSNKALQCVKRLINAQKAGHTGNLDIPASGLLPLCFGEATKMSTYLLDAQKSYVAEVRLGATTTTADAAGEIIQTRDIPELDIDFIERIFDQFRGTITQVPPMYSALKHNGERLYNLAHQGITVERKSRIQEIYRLQLIELTSTGFTIEVDCSKGTYIRTLAEDIGEAIGCGAHVLSLRRTNVGLFSLTNSLTLEALEEIVETSTDELLENYLLPVDAGLLDQPEVTLSEELTNYFTQGQAVRTSPLPGGAFIRIYDASHRFLGIGEPLGDGRVKPRRLMVYDQK